MHTAKPTRPHGTSGTIQTIPNVSDLSESSEAATATAAIASLNWSPPENHNETAIDFYELTLIGTPNNSTFLYKAAGTMAQQTFSSKYVLSDGNYTAVGITVVDLCEQRSESSQIMLSNINYTIATTTESTMNPQIDELNDTINNMQRTIDILGGFLAFMIAVIIAIIIIFISALIIYYMSFKRASSKSVILDNIIQLHEIIIYRLELSYMIIHFTSDSALSLIIIIIAIYMIVYLI